MVTIDEPHAQHQNHVLTQNPRVVSLVPSVTETLLSWGITPIACTRFCEQPQLTSVGGTKDPNLQAIYDLAPDLVIMEREENLREHYEALVAHGVTVHAMHVTSLDSLGLELNRLATALSLSTPELALPNRIDQRLRAFVPIWRKPWMALGQPSYGASLLSHLGVVVIPQDQGPYPEIEFQDAVSLNVDIVLAPSEPYPFTARQLPELEMIAPVVFIDGQDLFWWGVRTELALQRISVLIDSVIA